MTAAHAAYLVCTGTGLFRPVLFCLIVLYSSFAAALDKQAADRPAVISIIIDDLGKTLDSGRRALALPGPVACAFLPRATYTRQLASSAHGAGKEVLLHLPMDSVDGRQLDQGAVTLDMSESQVMATVNQGLDAVPHVSGINNHMGSLLTRHPGHMLWLMHALRGRGGDLYFVDSRTTVATVARQIARENGVPSIERDVFLDNDIDLHAIRSEFNRLIALANKQGFAVAIGHPYPQTLSLLEQQLPLLKDQGVQLVSVSELIERQTGGEQSWQVSLSPSHKAARNWKQ